MKKTMVLTALAVLSTSGMAFAQGTKPSEPRAEVPKGTSAEQTPPKPAPELEETKWMLGTWRCEGKAPAGAMGPSSPAFDYKSKMTVKKDMNNFALAVE